MLHELGLGRELAEAAAAGAWPNLRTLHLRNAADSGFADLVASGMWRWLRLQELVFQDVLVDAATVRQLFQGRAVGGWPQRLALQRWDSEQPPQVVNEVVKWQASAGGVGLSWVQLEPWR